MKKKINQAPHQPRRYTRRVSNSYYPRQSYNSSYRGRTFQRYVSNQNYENQPRNFTDNNQRGYRNRNYSRNHLQQQTPNSTSTGRNNNNNRVHLGNTNLLEEHNDAVQNASEEQNEIVNLFR